MCKTRVFYLYFKMCLTYKNIFPLHVYKSTIQERDSLPEDYIQFVKYHYKLRNVNIYHLLYWYFNHSISQKYFPQTFTYVLLYLSNIVFKMTSGVKCVKMFVIYM